jgi:hypothetical protein
MLPLALLLLCSAGSAGAFAGPLAPRPCQAHLRGTGGKLPSWRAGPAIAAAGPSPSHDDGSGAPPVYLDYSGTTPVEPRVIDAMLPFLRDAWGKLGGEGKEGVKTGVRPSL